MSISFSGDADPRRLSARLRALAVDLDHLIRDGAPRPADLADAPLLDWWRPAQRPDIGLLGLWSGCPDRPDGRPVLTSSLFALDADAGWARTLSRFYRLGQPCPGRPS